MASGLGALLVATHAHAADLAATTARCTRAGLGELAALIRFHEVPEGTHCQGLALHDVAVLAVLAGVGLALTVWVVGTVGASAAALAAAVLFLLDDAQPSVAFDPGAAHLGDVAGVAAHQQGVAARIGRDARDRADYQTVYADRDGVIIGHTEAPLVNSGDAVVHIASIVGPPPAEPADLVPDLTSDPTNGLLS